jgi:4-amino-4-deoxychorismate lyase
VWSKRFLSHISESWIVETTEVDLQNGTMETRMRNLDHKKVLYVEERGTWTKHGNMYFPLVTWADERTMVRNQTLLSSQLPSLLSSQVEKFSAKKYDENGEKQRMGMLSVLEMLREKCFPSHFYGHGLMVVDIDLGGHWHSV